MKYTTFLFDNDDTILDFKKCEWEAVREVFKRNGVAYDDATIQRYSIINDRYWKLSERGEITVDELTTKRFTTLLEELGRGDVDGSALNLDYRETLANYAYPVEGMIEFIKELSEYGEVDIITNGIPKVQRSRLAIAGIDKIVAHIFISGEIGINKPAKEYFDHVLANIAEKDKEKIVVIGDSLTSDIKGANNSGLDCVWFNPKKHENSGIAEPTYIVNNIDQLREILFK